jgi:MYXO-CTERM domain-containing protein
MPVEANSSKAWVAAPVTGSAAALLLLGFLFYWLRRRKRNPDVRLSNDELESWRKPPQPDMREKAGEEEFETPIYQVKHGRLSQWSRQEGTIEIGLAS